MGCGQSKKKSKKNASSQQQQRDREDSRQITDSQKSGDEQFAKATTEEASNLSTSHSSGVRNMALEPTVRDSAEEVFSGSGSSIQTTLDPGFPRYKANPRGRLGPLANGDIQLESDGLDMADSSGPRLMFAGLTGRDRPGPLSNTPSHLTGSQQNFFKLLDEKIERGPDYYIDEDVEDSL